MIIRTGILLPTSKTIAPRVNSQARGQKDFTVVKMKSSFFKKACKFNKGPKKIPF